MEKDKKVVVSTQIRMGENIYEYAQSEAERLAISLNSALNGLIDDGRRWRMSKAIIQMKE